MKSSSFCDQVVIVLGASSGIGKAPALQLAAWRAIAVIVTRRKDHIDVLSMEYPLSGGVMVVFPTDINDQALF
jgi:NADP-dependent 3-hydroxy acid dehydrogenase YdfG